MPEKGTFDLLVWEVDFFPTQTVGLNSTVCSRTQWLINESLKICNILVGGWHAVNMFEMSATVLHIFIRANIQFFSLILTYSEVAK